MRTVGRYEILEPLGQGGMAVVHLARQRDLDRLVALKELAAFHPSDTSLVQRFVRESRVAGSLAHPNVVTVFDFFESDGTPFIAMEYCERGSLRPFVDRLSQAQKFLVLDNVLSGLEHGEEAGIVHRDLKPENLMVSQDGRIKIADFGIAKVTDDAQMGSFLTATGVTVGTPAYMAPEQALARDIGPWTDLYSLGCIAYELFCGRLPFPDAPAPMALMLSHINEPVVPPQTVNPALDADTSDFVLSLLEKDPVDRPQSAGDVLDDLDNLASDLLGPRWARDARLLRPGQEARRRSTPRPTPSAPRVAPPGESAPRVAPPGESAPRVAPPAQSGEFETFRGREPVTPREPTPAAPPGSVPAPEPAVDTPPPAVAPEPVAATTEPATAAPVEPVVAAPPVRSASPAAPPDVAATPEPAAAPEPVAAAPPPATTPEPVAATRLPAAAPPAPAESPHPVGETPPPSVPRDVAPAAPPPPEPVAASAPVGSSKPVVATPPHDVAANATPPEPVVAPLLPRGAAPGGVGVDTFDRPAVFGAATIAPATPLPVEAEAKARARPRWVVPVVGGVAVAMVVAGFLVGRGPAEEAPPVPTPVAPRQVDGAVASIEVPGGWKEGSADPAAFGLEDAVVLTAGEREDVLLGQADAGNPSLLPEPLRERVGETAPERVTLGDGVEAYRFQVQDGERPLRIYTVPTAEAATVLVCTGGEALNRACDEAAASMRFSGAEPVPLGADPAYAKGLTTAIERLNSRRQAARRDLANARTPRSQRTAANDLAAAYAGAAKSIDGLEPPLAAREGHAALAKAAERAKTVNARLATAARQGRPKTFRAATNDAKAADADLSDALAALAPAGYRIG